MESYRYLVICMMLLMVVPITDALNYQVFTAKTELQYRNIDTFNMTELDSRSVIRCAVQCTNNCACFGFNSIINKCRVYKNCNLGDSVPGDNGWIYFAGTTVYFSVPRKSCKMLYLDGKTVSGVYTVYPWDISDPNYRPLQVFCDMDTAGGGWTIVQRRLGSALKFDRDWNAYKVGFGDPVDSYWLGNDALHQLTRNNVSLYISITCLNGSSFYKEYPNFFIESEATKYKLHIDGTQTGTLGEGFVSTIDPEGDLREMSFTTFDQDNDLFPINCAVLFGGGWWFNACHLAFLNGPMASISWGGPWLPDFVNGEFLNQTVMMIREH